MFTLYPLNYNQSPYYVPTNIDVLDIAASPVLFVSFRCDKGVAMPFPPKNSYGLPNPFAKVTVPLSCSALRERFSILIPPGTPLKLAKVLGEPTIKDVDSCR